jgi:hypothetical protein
MAGQHVTLKGQELPLDYTVRYPQDQGVRLPCHKNLKYSQNLVFMLTTQKRNAAMIIHEWAASAYSRTYTGVTLQD